MRRSKHPDLFFIIIYRFIISAETALLRTVNIHRDLPREINCDFMTSEACVRDFFVRRTYANNTTTSCFVITKIILVSFPSHTTHILIHFGVVKVVGEV